MASERERFEQEFPLAGNSDITWHEDRQQYLTSTKMWKATARGRTHALQGWQARARLAEQREAELVEALDFALTSIDIVNDAAELPGVSGVENVRFPVSEKSAVRNIRDCRAILAKHKAEGREGDRGGGTPDEQEWTPLSECEFECKYAIDEGHWVSQPVEVAAGWVHTDGPASVRVRRKHET